MEKYNFIENKWYSFNWDYSGKDCIVIAKIERVSLNTIIISWRKYLWDNSISIRDGYRYVDISNIKELSLCDIQQYLPEDHPEKIKVGSYLIRPDTTAPKALKITKIEREGYYTEPSAYFGPHPLLRFATEEEINKAENKLENLEKEFVLPEKWWIKVTKENQYIVGTWIMDNDKQKGINDLAQHTSYIGGIFQYPRNYDYSWKGSTYTPKEHTEITFEQFKKYVMKEEDKVEEEPKEDTKSIPKYWYIENKYQEVRDYLADTYSISAIKSWRQRYIGFDNSYYYNNGCHGVDDAKRMQNGAVEITIEQFREYFLSKPKEPKLTAVYLPTQEKWNFFIGKWNPMKLSEISWNVCKEDSCIDLSEGSYGDYGCYTEESYRIISFEQWCEDNGYTFKETKPKVAKDKKVEMKLDYSNYPKVSFEELQIGSKFVNIKYNTDIRTVTAKTVDTIYYSDSDGINQELYKEYWYKLDCRLISHPTSEYKVIPEPEVLEMVPIDKYFKIRN